MGRGDDQLRGQRCSERRATGKLKAWAHAYRAQRAGRRWIENESASLRRPVRLTRFARRGRYQPNVIPRSSTKKSRRLHEGYEAAESWATTRPCCCGRRHRPMRRGRRLLSAEPREARDEQTSGRQRSHHGATTWRPGNRMTRPDHDAARRQAAATTRRSTSGATCRTTRDTAKPCRNGACRDDAQAAPPT